MKDIKINDASYFPRPQAIYKELPINKTMGAQAGEYTKAWTFNGLIILASAGEYDDQHREEINRKSRARYRAKCGLKPIKEAE